MNIVRRVGRHMVRLSKIGISWVSVLGLVVVMYMGIGKVAWGGSRFVVTMGGEKILVGRAKSHKLYLRIVSDGGSQVVLRQYLVEPLRDTKGRMLGERLRCKAYFVGIGDGRIEWLDGESVSTGPKLIYRSSTGGGRGTVLGLEYWIDGSDYRSIGNYVSRLVLVLSDNGEQFMFSIPVEVNLSSVKNGIELEDGAQVLRINGDNIVKFKVFNRNFGSNLRLVVTNSDLYDVLQWSVTGFAGRWFSLRQQLSVPYRGDGVRIFLRVMPGALSGDYRSKLQVMQGAHLLGEVDLDVVVPEKTAFQVKDSVVTLKPQQGQDGLFGFVDLVLESNSKGGCLLSFQPMGDVISNSNGGQVSVSYLEYSVMEKVGDRWVFVLPWKKVLPGRNVIYRFDRQKLGKKKAGSVTLRVCYRFRKDIIKEIYAGKYEIPVMLSLLKL